MACCPYSSNPNIKAYVTPSTGVESWEIICLSDELTFMMGQFEARFPTDRLYAKNHMWAARAAGLLRFGFTAYAVRLLQDVYFLDWSIDAGTMLREKQCLGSIESKKAESDLYAPAAGRLVRFNESLLSDPSAINVDKYGEGWLFEMQTETAPLLSPAAYIEHLNSVWEVTQRTIKGQMNE
jgi:glycine cleavage system H protein